MYCSKCGKEILDGESKLCDECKNNLLTDIENESEEVKEEKSKKFKIKKEQNVEKKKMPKFIIAIIIILLVAAAIIGINYKTDFIGKYILGNNTIGIEIGNNNNNFGYANIQKNWIYYMSLSDDAMEIAINKIKTDGTEKTVLVQKDWEIYSINVVDDYIYFIAFEPTDENIYANNKIYKMSLDGKELTVINDNEFSDECKAIYVIKDKVFYIGEDYNVYSMDTNGENKTKLNDNETGFIGVTDKYILLNDYPENPQSETDFVTYIMDLDGKNIRPINGKRLYNANIVGEYIYYVNGENSEIHKIKVDGTEDTKIYTSRAYNMNVYGDYIYYLDFETENSDNIDEAVCIHRIKKDGTEHVIIVKMENYTSFINIVGDWIYYTDHNDNSYYINLIKTDGSEKINLYTYGYEG